MSVLIRQIQEAEKRGRLELAIVEWQRQLVRRREAQTAGRLESGDGDAASRRLHVLQDYSAAS